MRSTAWLALWLWACARDYPPPFLDAGRPDAAKYVDGGYVCSEPDASTFLWEFCHTDESCVAGEAPYAWPGVPHAVCYLSHCVPADECFRGRDGAVHCFCGGRARGPSWGCWPGVCVADDPTAPARCTPVCGRPE